MGGMGGMGGAGGAVDADGEGRTIEEADEPYNEAYNAHDRCNNLEMSAE